MVDSWVTILANLSGREVLEAALIKFFCTLLSWTSLQAGLHS